MEANNNLSGGMNSDISKIYQSNNEYLRAANFRPVTEKGGSNAALVNIKGNQLQVTFPNLKGVYRLRIVVNPNTTSQESITINGQTTASFIVDDNTTTADIYAQIILLSNCAKNISAVNPTFDVAYQGDDLVIYQLTTFTTNTVTNTTEPLIVINQTSGGPTDTQLYFVDTSNDSTLSYTPNVPTNTGDNLVVIGSTFINETFYLFTCPYTNNNDIGQIWQMDYNELTKVTTLVLLYNGLLNFHKEYPIPPSAAIGRFELIQIQRIYWSDNNNPVRSVNTKDINLMAFSLDLINLRPSIEMSIPVLEKIIDGGAVATLITTATYQCAYRLLKNNGAMSNFSSVSNLVTVIPQRTDFFTKAQSNFTSMVGQSVGVNKAITWEVDGIDPDFDIIEFYVIIRKSPASSTFNVYKFSTQLINGNTTISATFTNDPGFKEEITLDEFLLENTIFTHCKTLEQKDNRLFFGNVKNDINNALEDYDTRTFRFKQSTNDIYVKKFESDTGATQYTITNPITDYNTLQENADNISIINLGMSSLEDSLITNVTKNYKYKRNSTVIGGEGANISYSFGNVLLRMDATPNTPLPHFTTKEGTTRDVLINGDLYPHGYRRPTGDYNGFTGLVPNWNNNAPNQTYRLNDTIHTMGIEYLSGLFRTNQYNEIYRYGIMFRSKTGESSFVKWIGDIKMPDYSDLADPALLGPTDLGAVCPDFRSLYYDGVSAYSVLPYINFEVNISADLAATIDGYEIVRCERTENDKTIHSHGLITQVAVGPPSDPTNYYLPFSHFTSGSANIANADPPSTNTFSGRATPDMVAYHSMESLVSGSSSMFEEDDQLLLSEAYSKVWDVTINPSQVNIPNANELYAIKKYYSKSQNFYNQNAVPSTHLIKEAYYVDQDSITPFISTGGGVYVNQDWGIGLAAGQHYSIGNPTVIVGIKNSSFVWNTYGFAGVNSTPVTGPNGTAKLLGLHFKPSNLENQYGGRGFLQRASREYISTGAYVPVNDTAGSTSIKVFGGDIFHSILDIQKCIKNWFGTQAPANEKHSQTWFFPHQSTINIDLRDGIHVNPDLNTDDGTFASGNETYLYELSYSYPNNIKKFVAKPPFFNETNTWVNRVYWTDVKVNGENSDSWTSIPTLNYYDVEGGYGPINALIILKNNMHFIQDRAFGVLIINPLSVVNDNNGLPLKLATGTGTLEKHNYYTVDAGTKHQWSVFRSSNAISFVDTRSKKIYLFDGKSIEPISDIKNNRANINAVLHDNILVNDNPIINKGILTTYDYLNNEFLYTFLNTDNGEVPDEKNTLVFSDLLNKFTGFYSFTPYIYINNHNKLYSPREFNNSEDSTLWLHNVGDYCEFYGDIFSSSIRVNINDNPKYTKTFDNLSWISDSIKDEVLGVSGEIPYLNDTFKLMRCYNEYQNTDFIILASTNPITNLRKAEQNWNVQIPRNKVNYNTNPINTFSIFDPAILTKTTFGDRMRDKFIVIDLEYDNVLNNRFIVHNLGSQYRISDR
jgi:hypothetical protein